MPKKPPPLRNLLRKSGGGPERIKPSDRGRATTLLPFLGHRMYKKYKRYRGVYSSLPYFLIMGNVRYTPHNVGFILPDPPISCTPCTAKGECSVHKGGMFGTQAPLRNPAKSRLFGGPKNPILPKTSQEVLTGIFCPIPPGAKIPRRMI